MFCFLFFCKSSEGNIVFLTYFSLITIIKWNIAADCENIHWTRSLNVFTYYNITTKDFNIFFFFLSYITAASWTLNKAIHFNLAKHILLILPQIGTGIFVTFVNTHSYFTDVMVLCSLNYSSFSRSLKLFCGLELF